MLNSEINSEVNSEEISKIKRDLAMLSYTHKQFGGIVDNTLKYITELENQIKEHKEKEEHIVEKLKTDEKFFNSYKRRRELEGSKVFENNGMKMYCREVLATFRKEFELWKNS